MIGERDTSFKVIRTVLLACAALLCASCMWVPAARDDFSVMGNDVFSNLIREGRYDKGDATKGRGVGFSMLDSEKLSNLSQGLFLYKSASELSSLFDENGGECQPPVSSQDRRLLVCSIERRWRLINIGAPFDTSNWSDPAVKLLYEFTLSPNEIAVDLKLRIINITIHRKIKG